MAARAKKRRPRQKQLPGLEDPSIPELDKAAEAYVAVRDERMELTKEEVTKRDTVQRLMIEHGLTSYRFDSKVVSIVPGVDKVKVKAVGGDPDDEEDE